MKDAFAAVRFTEAPLTTMLARFRMLSRKHVQKRSRWLDGRGGF